MSSVESDIARLMRLIDDASDLVPLREEIDTDAVWYHEDPARAFELRCMEKQTAALGAIAMLLPRRDDEMFDEWQRYSQYE